MRYPVLKDVRDDEEVIVVRVRGNRVVKVGYVEDATKTSTKENGRRLGVALAKAMRQGAPADLVAEVLEKGFSLSVTDA